MRAFKLLYLVAFTLFCVSPIAVILSISITSSRFLTFPPQGFSLRWFAEIFIAEDWFAAFLNSVIIALASSALAVAIAMPVAYAAWRYGFRYAKALIALGIVPFILPPVIIALGFLLLFTSVGSHGFLINGIIAHAIFLLALPLVTISMGLESIERPLIEASATMGANSRQVFRTVIFPLVLPYVVAGFAFCLVISLNEYIILLMTVGFAFETLPIKVFNALRYGYSPILAAIAVLFLAINALIFGLVALFGNLTRLMGELDRD